jgi:hypothetical protein
LINSDPTFVPVAGCRTSARSISASAGLFQSIGARAVVHCMPLPQFAHCSTWS